MRYTSHAACVGVVAFAALVGCAEDSSGHDMHNALEKYQTHNVRHALDDDIQLSNSHDTLQHSGQWVNVTWKGVQDPQDDDFIALYAPAIVSIHETNPVKYQWAVKSASHRRSGAGSIRCAIEDLRQLSNLFWHTAHGQLIIPVKRRH